MNVVGVQIAGHAFGMAPSGDKTLELFLFISNFTEKSVSLPIFHDRIFTSCGLTIHVIRFFNSISSIGK